MSDRYGVRPGGEPAPAPARPGPVLGAAVLAFVQAGLLLALVVVVVIVAALVGLSPGGGVGVAALVCLAACSLAGLDLLGGLLLLRGGGRTVLLVTGLVEAALVGLLLLVAVVDVAVRRSADPLADLVGVLVLLTLLALPVVRLVLAARPAVAGWLAARRPPVPPPVWSPQAGWVGSAAPAQAVPTGLLTAALAPVAVLAVVATVTLALSEGSVLIADGPAAGYSGTGVPADPPAPGDRDHDPEYAGWAADCRDGDMAACDELYFETPIGDPYETYGSTCGGRLDEGTSGGCVVVFGPTD